jgi:hypothetical protein
VVFKIADRWYRQQLRVRPVPVLSELVISCAAMLGVGASFDESVDHWGVADVHNRLSVDTETPQSLETALRCCLCLDFLCGAGSVLDDTRGLSPTVQCGRHFSMFMEAYEATGTVSHGSFSKVVHYQLRPGRAPTTTRPTRVVVKRIHHALVESTLPLWPQSEWCVADAAVVEMLVHLRLRSVQRPVGSHAIELLSFSISGTVTSFVFRCMDTVLSRGCAIETPSLIRAVQELHLAGISHRDIKRSNLGLLTGHLSVFDFSNSHLHALETRGPPARDQGSGSWSVASRLPVCTISTCPPEQCVATIQVVLQRYMARDAQSITCERPTYSPIAGDWWAVGCLVGQLDIFIDLCYNRTRILWPECLCSDDRDLAFWQSMFALSILFIQFPAKRNALVAILAAARIYDPSDDLGEEERSSRSVCDALCAVDIRGGTSIAFGKAVLDIVVQSIKDQPVQASSLTRVISTAATEHALAWVDPFMLIDPGQRMRAVYESLDGVTGDSDSVDSGDTHVHTF